MSDVTLIEILRRSAIECAEENQPGWGNAMNDAAAALSAAEAEVERLKKALQVISQCETEYNEGFPCGEGPPVLSAETMCVVARAAIKGE